MNALSALSAVVLFSFTPASPLHAQQKPSAAPKAETKSTAKSPVQTKAEKLVLPFAGFAEAGVQESVDHIRKLSLKADTEGKRGVNIFLNIGDKEVPEITMAMKNVTVWNALQTVAQTAGLRVTATGDFILLHTEATTPRDRKASGLTESAVWKSLAGIEIGDTAFIDAPLPDVCNHFIEHAGKAGKILNLMYPVNTSPVTLTTHQAALTSLLEVAAELTGLEITAAGDILVLRPQVAAPARPPGKDAKAAPEWMKSDAWKRAGEIMLDDIAFIDAPAADVAAHLTKEAKAKDKTRKGLTISIPVAPPSLTLVFRKVKLSDIVLALKAGHGLEIAVKDDTISLTPPPK